MAPKVVRVLTPKTDECIRLTWQRGIEIAHRIKIANHLTLRWGDCSGLAGWKREASNKLGVIQCGSIPVYWFGELKEAMNQGLWGASKSWKR